MPGQAATQHDPNCDSHEGKNHTTTTRPPWQVRFFVRILGGLISQHQQCCCERVGRASGECAAGLAQAGAEGAGRGGVLSLALPALHRAVMLCVKMKEEERKTPSSLSLLAWRLAAMRVCLRWPGRGGARLPRGLRTAGRAPPWVQMPADAGQAIAVLSGEKAAVPSARCTSSTNPLQQAPISFVTQVSSGQLA